METWLKEEDGCWDASVSICGRGCQGPETDDLASSEILSIKRPISKLAPSKTHSILFLADKTGLATT